MSSSCFGLSWGDGIRDDSRVTLLPENRGTTSAPNTAPCSSSFTEQVGKLGQKMLSVARSAVFPPIQLSWSFGGNGFNFLSSWGGWTNRYPANNLGLKRASDSYDIQKGKLSYCAKNRQQEKTEKTARFSVEKGNKSASLSGKKDALTGKTIAPKANETPTVWDGLDATIKSLFPEAPRRSAANATISQEHSLTTKVRNVVSEQQWVTSKMNAWVSSKVDAWVNKQLVDWEKEESAQKRWPTDMNAARTMREAKRGELKTQADQQKQAFLQTAFFKDLLAAININNPDGQPNWEQIHTDVRNFALGNDCQEFLTLNGGITENLSDLSSLILRAQRECEHAQTQLVLELKRFVSRASQPNEQSSKALGLLQRLQNPDTNTFNGETFDFKCGLALTPNGMDALLCLEGKLGWSPKNKETYRNMLEVCAYLRTKLLTRTSSQGKSPSANSLEGLLKLANQHAVHYMIGATNDDPLRLAFQALVYSANELTTGAGPLSKDLSDVARLCGSLLGPKGASKTCKAGYVAWCNGFQTSGKGTEFNAALQRLFKFRTYYKRTTSHGDRTAWNLTRDLVRQIRKALLGDKKDPLLGMVSTGDMGSGFNLRVQEQHQEFQARLTGLAVENKPSGYNDDARYDHTGKGVLDALIKQLKKVGDNQAQDRLKVLELWKKEGARTFRVHKNDVGGSTATLNNAFGRSGFLHFRGPKVRLRTLEKWAVEAYGLNNGNWKEPLRMSHRTLEEKAKQLKDYGDVDHALGFNFLAQVNLLRRVANGGRLQGKDCGNLFQFSDLKNIILGRTARKTANKEMVKDVLVKSVLGDEVISSVDSTYKGFDPGSIANLGLGKVAFGGLIANFSTGRDAIMQCGDGAHGTELIMGSMKHVRTEWGVRFGLSFAKLDKFLKFGPFASFSKVHDSMSTGSKHKDGAVAILIPQDRDPDAVFDKDNLLNTGSNKRIAEKLTDFLIDELAAPEKKIDGIINLWSAWCEKFDDPSRISLGFRDLAYEGDQTRAEAGIAARVKWKDKYHGAMVAATYVGVKGTDSRADKAGRHQVTRQTNQNEKFGVLSAAVSQGSETMWADDSMSAATRAIPLIGAAVTFALDTENAITRLISENGKVNPVETNQDMVFADTASWKNHLGGAGNQDAWLYKKTASGYQPTTYKGWNGEEFVDVVAQRVSEKFSEVTNKQVQLNQSNQPRSALPETVVFGNKVKEYKDTKNTSQAAAIHAVLSELKKVDYNAIIDTVFAKEIDKQKTKEQEKPTPAAARLTTDEQKQDLFRARALGLFAANKMVNEAHEHAPIGSNAKTTRWVLHPAAAEKLTSIRSLVRTYRSMLQTAIIELEADSIEKIAKQIQAQNELATKIMSDKRFWQTKWATSANTVSKSNSFGWSWGLRFGNASAVSSRPKTQRVFYSGELRKQEANVTTDTVLQALAAAPAA